MLHPYWYSQQIHRDCFPRMLSGLGTMWAKPSQSKNTPVLEDGTLQTLTFPNPQNIFVNPSLILNCFSGRNHEDEDQDEWYSSSY